MPGVVPPGPGIPGSTGGPGCSECFLKFSSCFFSFARVDKEMQKPQPFTTGLQLITIIEVSVSRGHHGGARTFIATYVVCFSHKARVQNLPSLINLIFHLVTS